MIKHDRAERACPVCGGHAKLQPGQGARCWGFTSDDGEYAHCSRDELAGRIQMHPKTEQYPHKLHGDCDCGVSHGEAKPTTPAPTPIGKARTARVVAEYEYVDEQGDPLFVVVRKDPKAFIQRRPNGEWGRGDARVVPYHLDELVAAVEAGYSVWIVEGEKDCDRLRRAGVCATCNAGGAGKWDTAFGALLAGVDVTIVADRDAVGLDHARAVYASVVPHAKSVRVVEAASGKDASDHLDAGHGLEAFRVVYPIDDLREADPIEWKRRVIERAIDHREESIRDVDLEADSSQAELPMWPTGLRRTHARREILPAFRGLTILSGSSSAGKSWVSLASSLDAAREGWDVIYVSAEMPATIIRSRVERILHGDMPPSNWQLVAATAGADLDKLTEHIVERVGVANTLVVVDSLSSFIDQGEIDRNDAHGIAMLKLTAMWARNIVNETNGGVSFLLLSEVNVRGETKGRFGDHKANISVSIVRPDIEMLTRKVSVVKDWECENGMIGDFTFDPATMRLAEVAG